MPWSGCRTPVVVRMGKVEISMRTNRTVESKATCDSAPPNTGTEYGLRNWQPKTSDLKNYRHFDSRMSVNQIMQYVTVPENVTKHRFRPLFHFKKEWRRPPKKNKETNTLIHRGPKVRHIRYACRKDAYIYKYYREILSVHYEDKLRQYRLDGSVLAYRRIPVQPGKDGNKSNIHFAKDAFDSIRLLGKCCAVAIDISDFFGSINDDNLIRMWEYMIGVDKLPKDHLAVFNSITKYHSANIDKVLVALGYSFFDTNEMKYKYLVDPKKIPIQLCTPDEYRTKVVGQGIIKSRFESSGKNFGIPQGTPISDILANIYLFKFDLMMQKFALRRGGFYFRYSDDILLILPGDGRAAHQAMKKAMRDIKTAGTELNINPSKTEIVCYTGVDSDSEKVRCYSLKLDPDSKTPTKRYRGSYNDGLSYLGFRYDARKVYIRSSTISNLRRKVVSNCKVVARLHVKMHRAKSEKWLVRNLPLAAIKLSFLRVKDFDKEIKRQIAAGKSPFEKMTFWSYAKRAQKTFGQQGDGILRQLRNVETTAEKSLEKYISMYVR